MKKEKEKKDFIKKPDKKFVFTGTNFSRPKVPEINPYEDVIEFMQIDVDCDTYSQLYSCQTDKYNSPVLRIYGVTAAGNSVCCLVEDFYPYFYIRFPDGIGHKDLDDLKYHFNGVLKNKRGYENAVINMEIVEKTDFKYYTPNKENFIKITMKNPKYISTLREIIEGNENNSLKYKGCCFEYKTFESKVSFPLRYMIDNDIVGMSWITCPNASYTLIPHNKKVSTCQIELSISYLRVISHKPVNEFAKIAPIRILSFDIEAAAKDGHFPKADSDPVIQISNYVVEFGKNNNEPIVKNLFSFKKCADIAGADVHSYDNEADMLIAWRQFIEEVDPDIFIGYNIMKFDFPYLLDRAEHLKINNFPLISRIKHTVTKARNIVSNSAKAFNNRDIIQINIDGRSMIDIYLIIVKDHRLRSNTLNNVSFHFLKEQKEDVHHTMIYSLWNTDELTRKRLGLYCLKDAVLPWKLCEHLMIIYNYAEMCRVTCTPLGFILTRGQQIKVSAQIHRKAFLMEYVIPNERIKFNQPGTENQKGYEGATVLDPIVDFYRDPIVTLDFASLYPSIMIAHNLCYSTLVKDNDVKKYKPEDLFLSPTGHYFMKKHKRKGILPIILEDLINARKVAKQELKEATDEAIKAVLDGRQLAIKIAANSVYGFTGAQVGTLPCLEISATVTSVGRSMIEKTKSFVEERFMIKNGYNHNAQVVYGDTDSVMVKFGVKKLEEAMILGKEASILISEQFEKPVKIEFEKVYYPYLLMGKKRYSGVIWTKLDKYDKIDAKGIESVRRDNCELVKDTMDQVMNFILLDPNGVEKAIEFCKNVISDLLMNRVDISKLIISKSISKKVDDGDDSDNEFNKGKNTDKNKGKTYQAKQAHVELAEKMKKRDEGTAPNIGDRVSYVMVAGVKGSKNYENSEDPKYVIENDVPIDIHYYIQNQLTLPLTRLFDVVKPGLAEKIFCKILFNYSW